MSLRDAWLRLRLTLAALGAGAALAVPLGWPDEAVSAAPDTSIGGDEDAADIAALPASPDDPPARVGRVAEVNGEVFLYDDQAGDWRDASRNRPVTTGDRLSTGANGQAEVQVGSTTWRLGAGSELEVLQLDDARMRLQLHSGSLAIRLRSRLAAVETEVLTDEGRFLPAAAGHYRIDRQDDVSTAAAWQGSLRFESLGDTSQALTLAAGERREFWLEAGPGSPARHREASLERDAFADWVFAAEARESRSASTRYVSPEMTGVDDLDRYGRWESSVEYGPLWTPYSVVPGWAPYRYGRWAWVSPWGWTWVDDARWGFAPFHYGRWVEMHGRWAWAPGRYVRHPVYAPALVAWVGGPAVSVSVSVGGPPSVGWFPLGPREVYVPGYRVSPRYVRVVNVTHVGRIDGVDRIVRDPDRYMRAGRYRYRDIRDARTTVPADIVTGRRPVGPAWRSFEPEAARRPERERVVRPTPALPTPVVAREGHVARPGMPLRPPGLREGRSPQDADRDGRGVIGRLDPRSGAIPGRGDLRNDGNDLRWPGAPAQRETLRPGRGVQDPVGQPQVEAPGRRIDYPGAGSRDGDRGPSRSWGSGVNRPGLGDSTRPVERQAPPRETVRPVQLPPVERPVTSPRETIRPVAPPREMVRPVEPSREAVRPVPRPVLTPQRGGGEAMRPIERPMPPRETVRPVERPAVTPRTQPERGGGVPQR